MLCSREESSTTGSRILRVHCPFCSADSTQVIDTRPIPDGVRRRRECGDCGERFTTYERVEEPRLDIVKRDGRRERFDRQKLLRGLARAAGGRPVSTDQLETVATWIAEEARRGGSEVEAARIGDPRREEAKVGRLFNLPPSYLLIHRVTMGSIGVLSQLGATAPFRALAQRWQPGFA